MPEALKAQVELTAAAEGISVNAWLVRTVSAAVHRPPGEPRPATSRSGKHITGFAQA
jgi:hypothetical protein